MKSIYIFVLLFLFSFKVSFSQDTIFMRNNTTVLAKVLEVNQNEIKYKRFEVPDGPTYTEDKANIKEIHYVNGLKDVFKLETVAATDTILKKQPRVGGYKIETIDNRYRYMGKRIGRKEVKQLLLNSNSQAVINLELKSERANKLQNIGFVGIGCAVAAFDVAYLGLLFGTGVLPVAGVFALAAIPLSIIGVINHHNNKLYKQDAVRLYNQKY